MKKAILNFWVDFGLFLTFLGLASTGAVLKWVVPSHCGEGGGWRGGIGNIEAETSRWFLGIHRSQWLDFHFFLSVALVALTLAHFVLHWNWIVCFLKSNFFSRRPPAVQ